jgi:hypothetical protein
MSTATQINLDTSVLMNYIYSHIPGGFEDDRGSHQLMDDDAFYIVVGGKVRGEFNSLCDRRHELYDDIIDFLEETDQEIFDYNAQNREIHLSDNDQNHLRHDLQFDWVNKDKEERLSILRRIVQDIELYKLDILNVHLDECYSQYTNDDLLDRLENELSIGHDRDVLVDAIEIAREHSIRILVAVDSDITDTSHAEDVYDIVDDLFEDRNLLRIKDAGEL